MVFKGWLNILNTNTPNRKLITLLPPEIENIIAPEIVEKQVLYNHPKNNNFLLMAYIGHIANKELLNHKLHLKHYSPNKF